jgi:sortase A
MIRALSFILIFAGLTIAGSGVYSIWTSREAARVAEEQWNRDLEQRRTAPPKAQLQLARGSNIARLSIDRLGSRWIVVEGAGKAELKLGPGHLVDSALPGARGNCVIAGHRDTQFRILRKVEIGEEISVERNGRRYLYRVTERRVVSPVDTRSLDPTASPTLTLVTCYPFYYVGPAPQRFVVRADLIRSDAGPAS